MPHWLGNWRSQMIPQICVPHTSAGVSGHQSSVPGSSTLTHADTPSRRPLRTRPLHVVGAWAHGQADVRGRCHDELRCMQEEVTKLKPCTIYLLRNLNPLQHGPCVLAARAAAVLLKWAEHVAAPGLYPRPFAARRRAPRPCIRACRDCSRRTGMTWRSCRSSWGRSAGWRRRAPSRSGTASAPG